MFDEVKKTYIENLSKELLEIPTVMFQLSSEELKTMLDVFNSIMNGETPSGDTEEKVNELRVKIDNLIKTNFPDGCFIKLGSRSPKDSWLIRKNGMCCKDGQYAMSLLFDSERIMDDLYIASANNYLPHVVLRKWVNIDPWREFRCFIRNKELVGISQYFYKTYYPQIIKNKDNIEKVIKDKVQAIRNLLPVDTVIVDFIYNDDKTATIIEFNPYDIFTDPCLFDWKKDAFENFEFRYLKEEPPKAEDFSLIFLKENLKKKDDNK